MSRGFVRRSQVSWERKSSNPLIFLPENPRSSGHEVQDEVDPRDDGRREEENDHLYERNPDRDPRLPNLLLFVLPPLFLRLLRFGGMILSTIITAKFIVIFARAETVGR